MYMAPQTSGLDHRALADKDVVADFQRVERVHPPLEARGRAQQAGLREVGVAAYGYGDGRGGGRLCWR